MPRCYKPPPLSNPPTIDQLHCRNGMSKTRWSKLSTYLKVNWLDVYRPPKGFPKLYFFYDSFQIASHLAETLGLAEEPTLMRASVRGYKQMMWGDNPTLVDPKEGDEGETIYGVAFEVMTPTELQNIRMYEGIMQKEKEVMITFRDPFYGGRSPRMGKMFKRRVDELMHLLREGEFDIDQARRALERKEME